MLTRTRLRDSSAVVPSGASSRENRIEQWLVSGADLQGPAKEVVRACKPQDCKDARGAERLLRILRESPLAPMPVPDANKKIQAYDQIMRRPIGLLGDYIVREKRAFRERQEKDGRHRRQHHTSPANSPIGRQGRKNLSIFNKVQVTFFELEIGGCRLPSCGDTLAACLGRPGPS